MVIIVILILLFWVSYQAGRWSEKFCTYDGKMKGVKMHVKTKYNNICSRCGRELKNSSMYCTECRTLSDDFVLLTIAEIQDKCREYAGAYELFKHIRKDVKYHAVYCHHKNRGIVGGPHYCTFYKNITYCDLFKQDLRSEVDPEALWNGTHRQYRCKQCLKIFGGGN